MAKERFEKRRLFGQLNVACKFDDGTVRTWADKKEIVVAKIVEIVERYQEMGYKLTLRQLHYQFVGHVVNYVNHDTAYKKLGKILDDCRYGGIIDWDAIEDRGRVPSSKYTNSDITDALESAYRTFNRDLQEGQDNIVELWTEKDALSGILKRSSYKYCVPLVVNKGYTSSSALYNSYDRFVWNLRNGRKVTILYFGDHDPSGLDMVRDIKERIEFMITNGDQLEEDEKEEALENFRIIAIGLTKAQIKQYKLPPNPTKMTDSRSPAYIKAHGKQCWEVDALDPTVLTQIVEKNIESEIDMDVFEEMQKTESSDRLKLRAIINKAKKDK